MAPTSCALHPDRERLALCAQCGNGVCRDCVVHTGVGIKCPTCTGEAAKPAARSARSGGGGAERPRWMIPAVIAAVVALIAGFLVLRSGGGGSDNKNQDEFAGQTPERASEFERERKADFVGGGGVHIGGLLTRPNRETEIVGGALVIPGFGAIDRDATMASSTDQSADRLSQDQNYSRPGTPDNVFRDLNDVLLSKGLLTLRYDKRGGGASPLAADQALSFDDLVADAKAALTYLAERVEVAGKPLAVLGFDQGGLIAMRLASDPRVKTVALVSTFARPLADVVGTDLITARGDPAGTAQSTQLHEVVAKLLAGQPLPPPQELNGNLRAVLRPNQEKYLRQVFGLDAVAEARNVKRPALLVRGANDTTVTAEDSARLKPALPVGTEEMVVADGDHNLGVKGVRDPVAMSQVASWVARSLAS